jgi:hypothetical protein
MENWAVHQEFHKVSHNWLIDFVFTVLPVEIMSYQVMDIWLVVSGFLDMVVGS